MKNMNAIIQWMDKTFVTINPQQRAENKVVTQIENVEYFDELPNKNEPV